VEILYLFIIIQLDVLEFVEELHMKNILKCNGAFVTINGHKVHVYIQGNKNAPAIVLMSGHCTVAPVYDFKVLYEKLLPDFRVIVIEKYGYGYSDICQSPCDIDTLVSIQRQALSTLGEAGPYILAPHSMSGLEAIRWKQKFPDEVRAIVGIDMATPLSFSVWTEEDIKKTVRLMRVVRKLKLASILSSVSTLSLTEDEIEQHKLLKKRNAFNICCINEAVEVLNNARVVGEDGNIQCPALLFSSNGEDQERDWVKNQQKFAASMGAKLISYDCGHYIHHFKSDEMCQEIRKFINSLD
jgi:pimeloyl-ACP methyl ester carboxylesterase